MVLALRRGIELCSWGVAGAGHGGGANVKAILGSNIYNQQFKKKNDGWKVLCVLGLTTLPMNSWGTCPRVRDAGGTLLILTTWWPKTLKLGDA